MEPLDALMKALSGKDDFHLDPAPGSDCGGVGLTWCGGNLCLTQHLAPADDPHPDIIILDPAQLVPLAHLLMKALKERPRQKPDPKDH